MVQLVTIVSVTGYILKICNCEWVKCGSPATVMGRAWESRDQAQACCVQAMIGGFGRSVCEGHPQPQNRVMNCSRSKVDLRFLVFKFGLKI